MELPIATKVGSSGSSSESGATGTGDHMGAPTNKSFVPSLGRIGFLLSVSPWICVLISNALNVPPTSFIENMAILLMVVAPVALIFSVAGLIGDHRTLWAVFGSIVALFTTCVGGVASRS